ncbi:AcrR family transcriptional regulator [Nakamurella sp. UYEF19]|uniref:TetR/AcrR family transcriptional regulator n=1 Tax=Nakamurella sp. UYEF19 TaxID=1756392 RepID=UPI003391CCF1
MKPVQRPGEPRSLRIGASAAAREHARESARAHLRAVARRHIAERGLADLSLRAVARELNMTSSAIYRYYASREELIGSLIAESYEDLALIAETTDRQQAGQGVDAAGRWLAICRELRNWAGLHPHDYSLIHSSPVIDQASPLPIREATVRIWRVIAGIVDTAVTTGALHPPARPFEVGGLIADHVLASVSRQAPPFTDYIIRAMALFSSLLGAIAAEMFGLFDGLAHDADRVFDLVVATGAAGVGLELPVHADPRRE